MVHGLTLGSVGWGVDQRNPPKSLPRHVGQTG